MTCALTKDDRIIAIREGVAKAFGYDNIMGTNIWASPKIRGQILQAIENGVEKAVTKYLEEWGLEDD